MKRYGFITLMIFAVLVVVAARADESTNSSIPLTLESMRMAGRIGDPTISPDGRTVAFVAAHNGPAKIWIVSISGGEPKPLLEGKEAEGSPQWSPDGKSIAFLSARNGQQDIFVVSRDGGSPSQVTNEKSVKHGIRWSPDGTQIAYISNRFKDQDIYVVSAKGGDAKQLTHNTNEWDEFRWYPVWSPDSKHIAFVSGRSDYYSDDLWMVDANGENLQKMTNGVWVMANPVWSPDGKSIAFNGNKHSEYWYEDQAEIYVFDVGTRKLKQIPSETFVSDFEMNAHMFWSPDSTLLYFRNISRGDTNIWAIPINGKGEATQITNYQGAIPAMDLSSDGKWIAFTRVTPVSPGDLYAMPAAGGEAIQLTNWAVNFKDVSAPTQISYKSKDGLYIHGYLFKPPHMAEGRTYPGLVSVHGGGTNSYGHGFHAMEQYLAQKGFVVLAIEYRGSSGYGRPFQLLSVGDWTGGQGWDAVAAADVLRSLPYCSKKIGIYGGSYGGIMTMAAVTKDSSKFQAAAPFYGIYDWVAAYDDADRLGKIFLVTGFDGYRPEDNPEMYYRNSTINFLDKVTTPLLIEHGELDRRAPYSQAIRLTEALKKANKTFEFFHYPNEQHGIRNQQNFVDAYTRMEAWFDKYLK